MYNVCVWTSRAERVELCVRAGGVLFTVGAPGVGVAGPPVQTNSNGEGDRSTVRSLQSAAYVAYMQSHNRMASERRRRIR